MAQFLQYLDLSVHSGTSLFNIEIPVQVDDFNGEGVAGLQINSSKNRAKVSLTDDGALYAVGLMETDIRGRKPSVVPHIHLRVSLGWEVTRADANLLLESGLIVADSQYPQRRRVGSTPYQTKLVASKFYLVPYSIAKNTIPLSVLPVTCLCDDR